MQNLAESFSPEEIAYFGEDTLAKHASALEGFPEETIEPQVPIEEAAPEAKADEKPAETAEPPADKPAEAQAKPESRMVDIGALHAARAENKELKEQHNRLETRFNELLDRLRQPQQQPQEQPKPVDEDPVAAVKRHEEWVQRQQLAEQESQAYNQLQNIVSQHEAQFRTQEPNYDAALQHLTNARALEYRAMGLAEPAIAQALHTDAINLAAHALRNGRNPAEMIFALAQSRGFAPPATAPAEEKAAPAEVPAEKQMDMLEAGARASKGLQSGGTAVGEVTLEAIANMSSKEIGNLSETQWRKAMMGRA